MAKEVVVTHQGLQALENELEHLKTVRRKEVAEKIKDVYKRQQLHQPDGAHHQVLR